MQKLSNAVKNLKGILLGYNNQIWGKRKMNSKKILSSVICYSTTLLATGIIYGIILFFGPEDGLKDNNEFQQLLRDAALACVRNVGLSEEDANYMLRKSAIRSIETDKLIINGEKFYCKEIKVKFYTDEYTTHKRIYENWNKKVNPQYREYSNEELSSATFLVRIIYQKNLKNFRILETRLLEFQKK